VRQAGAALQAATLQHETTSATRHAGKKAVHAGAVALLGLVRSFWHTRYILQEIAHLGDP